MEERRVRDVPGEHAFHRQAVPAARLGRHRHAPSLGLQPEQAAPGGRDPDRARAVGAEQSENTARFHFEIDVIQDMKLLVGLLQSFYMDCFFHPDIPFYFVLSVTFFMALLTFWSTDS